MEVLEQFRERYDVVVNELLDNKDPRLIPNGERNELKKVALELTLADFPALKRPVSERRYQMVTAQFPVPKPVTESQQLGAAVIRQTAHVWRTLLCGGPKPETEEAIVEDGSLGDRYRLLAETVDVLPPDKVAAILYGCTSSNVGHSRRVLEDEGYKFEKVNLPAEADGKTYHWVVKTRPQPEPEPEVTQEEQVVLDALKGIPTERLLDLLAQALE